jgi:hypothetical protein
MICVEKEFISDDIMLKLIYNMNNWIVAPNSIKVSKIEVVLINMVTIGIPRSTYFFVVMFVDIRLANFPTTCTIVGSFLFLPDFLRHNSLIVFFIDWYIIYSFQ